MSAKYLSYTYFMRWSAHDKQYYGVRTANKCEPENDLWHEYQSSSDDTKEFIEKHGKPDIMYVDKTFDDPEKARDYEVKILQENDVVNDDRWLNKNDRRAPPILSGEKNGFYGKKHSKETRQKISKKMKGKLVGEKNPFYGKTHSPEVRQKISEANTGENNVMYGKELPLEHRQKISKALTGKPKSEEHKRKLSEAGSGENHPNWGKTYEERWGKEKAKMIKEKQSAARKNKTLEEIFGEEKAAQLKEQKSGAKNPNFKGYYITPLGKFETVNAASTAHSKILGDWQIRNYCRNNQRMITKRSLVRSTYLTDDMLGKTFKEIGFDFEPKI